MCRSSSIAAVATAAIVLAACASASAPTLDGSPASAGALPPVAAAPPSQPAQAPPPAVSAAGKQPVATGTVPPAIASGNGGDIISAAKGTSVVLYASPIGADGQRVPSSTMGFPISARNRTPNGRYEVMTTDGPRWIAAGEVVFANQAQQSAPKR